MGAIGNFLNTVNKGMGGLLDPILKGVASLAPIAGGIIGFLVGGPVGAMIGFGVGQAAGSLVGMADQALQTSEYEEKGQAMMAQFQSQNSAYAAMALQQVQSFQGQAYGMGGYGYGAQGAQAVGGSYQPIPLQYGYGYAAPGSVPPMGIAQSQGQ